MKLDKLIAVTLGLSICTGAALAFNSSEVKAESKKPDIFVIMVDDHAFLQNERVLKRLPTINNTFIQNGIRFTQMYQETPLCAPGRAAFLTGQSTLHHGVYKNDGDLLNPRRTIAAALDRVGYETYMVGKYLNQYDGPRDIAGWDKVSIFYNDANKLINQPANMLQNAPKDKPVFMWASSSWPHKKTGSNHPFVPEKYRNAPQCQGIANFKPPTYKVWKSLRSFPYNMPYWPAGWKMPRLCESMIPVDEMVANIKSAQAARNRPAYYVFFSDNGMAWGQKGNPAKHVPHSTRLPFYVAGPGITGGVSTGKLLSLMDVAPTFAQIGNANMWWVDGRSFLPLLKGQKFSGRKCILETYKHPKHSWNAVRCKNWHYIRYANGKKKLYHTSVDKWERWNLAKKKPYKVKEMNKKLNWFIKNSRS